LAGVHHGMGAPPRPLRDGDSQPLLLRSVERQGERRRLVTVMADTMITSRQPIGTSNEGGPQNAGPLGASDRGAADWLSLAAAPTFAVMALLTAIGGGGPLDVLCSGASAVGGMVPMYVLMSAFHAAPWLKLISRRLDGIHQGRE